MLATARLELRINPEDKALIERAASLSGQSVTAFAIAVLSNHAHILLDGPTSVAPPAARPIGGWTFILPEGWDAPLADFDGYR